MSDRIFNIKLKTPRGYLTMVHVYAPEEGRQEENIEFYELLQSHLNSINKSDYLAVCADFNARISQQPIDRILGMNGENVLNENGKTLKNFAIFNELRIHFSVIRISTSILGQHEVLNQL
jgi:hypothetical protein